MTGFCGIELHSSKVTGLSLENIKDFSPSELRDYIEKKGCRPVSFVSEFPVIGRGNILRDGLATSKQINKDIDKILGLKL